MSDLCLRDRKGLANYPTTPSFLPWFFEVARICRLKSRGGFSISGSLASDCASRKRQSVISVGPFFFRTCQQYSVFGDADNIQNILRCSIAACTSTGLRDAMSGTLLGGAGLAQRSRSDAASGLRANSTCRPTSSPWPASYACKYDLIYTSASVL